MNLKPRIDHYVQGKRWYWYVPLLALGIYIFFCILQFDPNKQSALVILPAQSINFGLHELSHVVMSFLPAVLTASAGSMSELLLGALLIFGAFKTRNYFTVMFCCLWFMLSAQSAGLYMADARAQKMDLVSLGAALSGSDQVTHDWNFVFGKLHLLAYDKLIGGTVRGIGILVALAGIGFATWLMFRMATAPGPESPSVHLNERDKLHEAAVQAGKDIVEGTTPIESRPTSELYPEVTHGRSADSPTDEKT